MGVFRQFPYSNFHEMNMDEIIKIVKTMLEEWAQYYAEWDSWMSEINDDWSNYQEVMNEAWQNMQNFINNYFNNLDVQTEINKKITTMVYTGEFASIINPYIPPSVAEWLSANITEPTGVVIDTSLTVAGACADAKATGDAIRGLSDEMDIRSSNVVEFIESDNVLDPETTMTTGFYTDPHTGNEVENNDFCSSDFVKVTGGKYLIFSDTLADYVTIRFIAEYDATKQIIVAPSQNQEGTGNGTHYSSAYLLLNANTAYIKFSARWASLTPLDHLMISLSETTTAPPFVKYIEPHWALKRNIPTMDSVNHTNLLNGVTMYDGKYVSHTTGLIGDDEHYITSDYIEVTGGEYLISASDVLGTRDEWFTLAQYDSTQTVIPGSGTGDGTSSRSAYIILNADTAYIRITYGKSNYYGSDTYLFQSDRLSYEHEDFEIKDINLEDVYSYINEQVSFVGNPLYGKKVSWYGDSIMHYTWWAPLNEPFHITSINNGIDGTRISGTSATAMCQSSRIEGTYVDDGVAIPSDTDYIIIGGGTNDWAQSVALGEKNIQYDENWDIVEDVTTFYQACHVMFRRLSELRPDAKIIVLGTPFGKCIDRIYFTNKYGLLNNQGLTSLDYGNALCDVAEMWGHYALRYGNYMGINDSNVETLLDPTSENGSHLHPSTDEARVMFRKATVNGLMQIKYMP